MKNRLEMSIRYGLGAPLPGVALKVCATYVRDRRGRLANPRHTIATQNLSSVVPCRGPSSSRLSSSSGHLQGYGPAIQTP